jgi:ABC-type multidrug transport system fused ATPase/permease subunit
MKGSLFSAHGDAEAQTDLTLKSSVGEIQDSPEVREYLRQEAEVIAKRKRAAGSDEQGLVGLAFSGGGIRSAAFSFGVLQVLEEKGVMRHVDYLSTVSGGGYTGTAYSAWRLRQVLAKAQNGSAHDADLRVQAPPPARLSDLLTHVRNFSNYIAPGFGSTGTARIVSTFVRNLTLHWTVLVAAIVLGFATLLLTLRFLWALSLGIAVVGAFFMGRGIAEELRARRYFTPACQPASTSPERCADSLHAVRRLLQYPRLRLFTGLGLYALAAALWFVSTTLPVFPRGLPLIGEVSGEVVAAGIFALSGLLVVALGFVSEWRWSPRRDFWPKPAWAGMALVVAIVPLTWRGLADTNAYFTSVSEAEPIALADLFVRTTAWSIHSAWRYVWQAALVLGLFALVAAIVIAVLNRQMDREEREWATRVIAVSLVVALVWLLIPGLALLSAKLAELVAFHDNLSFAALLSGIGLSSVALSGWAARLGQTQAVEDLMRKYWKRLLVAIGPAVFIVGLVLTICFAAAWALMVSAQDAAALSAVPRDHLGDAILWSGPYVLILFTVAGAVFLIAGLILDPNEFSLHGFYRDRLVRCFLGASNGDTPAPNAIWDIATDDLPLATTVRAVEASGAPFHLINSAVNLFGSKDIRVQRRHSDSFVLTPLHAGSLVTNYAPTPPRLYLGTAMAISGAAVAPNMGVYTHDPALAALMTFFNLRLGYWYGNPRLNVAGKRKRPLFAPAYLFAEAFALTNEDRSFVNLSDGGHYDNLGVYELLRRRCRYIIAVDAECDPEYHCTALAWLVRMARIDFGIDIEIDIDRLVDRSARPCKAATHWLQGEIHYPNGERGQLLYIKSSVFAAGKNGRLSADIIEYANRNPAFPHEPTSDQFFSEAQFEAYRRLGEAIAGQLFAEVPVSRDVASIWKRVAEGAMATSRVG